MSWLRAIIGIALAVAGLLPPRGSFGANAASDEAPSGAPGAVIDLMSPQGVALVRGNWRYSDIKIVETEFRAAGADGQPGTRPVRTYDFTPHAGAADFDDSSWEIVAPEALARRRSNGRLAFNWYRIGLTVPERVGDFDTAGSTLVFETSVDDYAEVWVDGELPRAAGQNGGSVIKGWNAANRLVVGRGLRPGQKIQLAVFGMNGPVSDPPTNYIWMRTAKLELYRHRHEPRALAPHEVNIDVLRVDAAIDEIVPLNPKLYKLADGFQFTEGPLWVPEGFLLFSDPNANRIYKYVPDGQVTVFRDRSGYQGDDVGRYRQPGSNGLALDGDGRLTINEHGNRRVTRLERDGSLTVVADRYDGKRLNSPNDLVYRADGSLYFTDPPFGLPAVFDDPGKELSFSGVYRRNGNGVELLANDMKGPNGIAFSPDERFLYVANWDVENKIIMRYEVGADGRLKNGTTFFDMNGAPGEDALDGLKVDQHGNVYSSGPGGIWILSAAGQHLGTLRTPHLPANMAWGDADGRTLYLTARTGLYRIRLNVAGAGLRWLRGSREKER
jgi:gluconolactonase